METNIISADYSSLFLFTEASIYMIFFHAATKMIPSITVIDAPCVSGAYKNSQK